VLIHIVFSRVAEFVTRSIYPLRPLCREHFRVKRNQRPGWRDGSVVEEMRLNELGDNKNQRSQVGEQAI